jgi:hypothetical protein
MLLEEHLSGRAQEQSDNPVYEPTPEQEKTIRLVNKLLGEAKSHRQLYDKDWLDYYRLFRGVQWKESRPVYRHAEVINLVFQSIQSVVPQVADTQQKFAYKAQEPADRELAQILNDVAESDWARKNWSAIQYELLLDAHLYGTGISELGVEFENGLAEICYRTIDPFYFYPDPSAVDTNREGRYAITAIPRAVETIKSEYPDMANFISADLSDVMSNQRNELAPFRLRTGTDGRMPIEGPATKEPSIENTALFITCYLKSKRRMAKRFSRNN